MRTIATPWKYNLKIRLILYAIFITVVTGCSKEDQTTAVIESIEVEVELSSEKRITSFVFLLTNNPIDVNVVATIDEESKTIIAAMPPGTSLSGLIPEVKISDFATINIDTAQDFSNPLEYRVTAEDGSTATYTATITAALSQRSILQIILNENPGNTLGWVIPNSGDLGALEGITTNINGEITGLRLPTKGLTSIPTEIGQLTTLKSLDLDSNSLTSIPTELGQLTNLEYLDLDSNSLTSIPTELGQLTNLEFLDLSHNQLTSIPPELGQLTNLGSLVLFNNSLTSISPELGQLTNLEFLYLSGNQLTSIPPEIGQLTNLKELYLSENQLTSIPPEIGQLTDLLDLRLNDNQLTSVPPEIGFLTKLRVLFIQNNDLITIPSSILYIEIYSTELGFFQIDSNIPIGTSQKDVLISLYIANPENTLNWGVDNYPEVEFDENGNPKVITMNNKNLTKILNDIEHLEALETLNVNGNNLESLPETLGTINTLTTITAANNQLSTVPPALGQLTNLSLLSVTDNPITGIPQEVCDVTTANSGILTLLTDPGEGCD